MSSTINRESGLAAKAENDKLRRQLEAKPKVIRAPPRSESEAVADLERQLKAARTRIKDLMASQKTAWAKAKANPSTISKVQLRKQKALHDQDLSSEIWKTIPDFPGYEVSDCGRIRSTLRWVKKLSKTRLDGTRTECLHIVRPRVLKQNWQRGGLKVTLSRDGVLYQRTVHQLVMLIFVGAPPHPKMDVCHNGDNPANQSTEQPEI